MSEEKKLSSLATFQHHIHQRLDDPDNNYDNNIKTMSGVASIGDFYSDAHVFVTGATGFLGKPLVEKLLRTCNTLSTIYVLIRAKGERSSEQRLAELLSNPVFDRVRTQDGGVLQKVHLITGDMALPQFGLGATDRRLLVDHVHVVIHAAATVRFTDELHTALMLNTRGTRFLLELAVEMRSLRAFVHVSTAFSNANRCHDVIGEMVYAPPPADPEYLLAALDRLADEEWSQLERELIGGQNRHPNTYTFSKAVAETLVQQYATRLPIAIVRPSIVMNAWKEPFAGWIDHATGVVGVMMEVGRGSIQSIIGHKDALMDIVPVDIVCNTLITAAWHVGMTRAPGGGVADQDGVVQVYNCTSGRVNQIRWGTWGEMTIRSAIKYPTKYVTWYPQLIFRSSRLAHFFDVLLLQFGPACLADLMLLSRRRRPIMLKMCKRVERHIKAGEFFVVNEFDFDVSNWLTLQNTARAAIDGANFEMDMSGTHFEWQAYNEECMLGIRMHVLKDDISSLSQARRTLNRLYSLKRVLQLVAIYLFLRMTIL